MDWAMIRKSMDDAMQACIENDGVMDEAAKQLVAFVPDDPNEKADAKWLKERGWEYFDDDTETLYSPVDIDFRFCDGVVFMADSNGVKASRMYVALFEAAMEAMKHGE